MDGLRSSPAGAAIIREALLCSWMQLMHLWTRESAMKLMLAIP